MNQEPNGAEEERVFEGKDFSDAVNRACAFFETEADHIEFVRVLRKPGDDMVRVRAVRVVDEGQRDTLYREQREEMKTFAQKLLQALNMDCEVSEELHGFSISLAIEGDDANRFTQKNGSLLNEIQFLLSRYFKASFADTVLDLKCDANDFRKRQEEKIRDIAQKACDQVTESKEAVVLAPMNSYERRLVHLVLKDRPSVRTISLGDGNIKRVKILFKEIKDPGPVSEFIPQD